MPERSTGESDATARARDPREQPRRTRRVSASGLLSHAGAPEHQWGGPREASAHEEDEKGEARGAAIHLVVKNIE